MKKILSLILTMVFVLSLGVVAFADEAGNTPGNQDSEGVTSVIFKKSVETIGNTGAKNPAETFNFTISPKSGLTEQNVAITPPVFVTPTFSILVGEGLTDNTKTVNLPDFPQVGTYVYKVVETASDTAGMVYDVNEYEFTVIVLNDGVDETNNERLVKRLILADSTGKKTDVFMNEYKAGSLTVNKTITGNNANFVETFPVKVTLTGPDAKLINSTITVAGAVGTTVPQTGNGTNEVVITFDVTNGSNVVISNIPAGVAYRVEEVGVVEAKIKGYTVTYDDNITGTIVENANQDTTIINDLSREIATGIFLDSIPYIIVLGAAAVGVVFLVLRKRKQVNF